MSTTNPTKHTPGRKLKTPLALLSASALIWTLPASSTTVGQQASQSASQQATTSQTAVANTVNVERDSATAAESAAVENPQRKGTPRPRADKSPLLVTIDSPLYEQSDRKRLKQWADDGIVRTRDSFPGAMPGYWLNLSPVTDQNSDAATQALLELSELGVPEVDLSLGPDPHPKDPEHSAILTLDARSDWEPARKMVEVLNRRGIPTKAVRRPSLSLWAISSTFSAPDVSVAEELKPVVKELGLAVADKDLVKLSTDVLFPKDVAAIYEPEKAASVLNWLKTRQLVLEAIPGNEQTSSMVSQFLAPAQSSPLVKRKSKLDWTAGPSRWQKGGIDIDRQLWTSEEWRGKSDLAQWNPGDGASMTVDVEPGRLAVIHAFPTLEGYADPASTLVPTAHNQAGYVVLLVIENHAADQPATSSLTDSKASPKLAAPDAASPIRIQSVRSGASFTDLQSLYRLFNASNPKSSAAERSDSQIDALATARNDSGQRSVAAAAVQTAPPPKLVVVGDGGAKSEQDRERLRKLIEAGILVRDDSVPQTFRAQLTLQPKVPADKLAAQGMGMLAGGIADFSPADAKPATLPAINADWDKAVRSLHSFLHNRASHQWRVDKCDVRLSYDPYVSDADARLVIPEASPDEFAEIVMDLFREAGLTVITWRQHPVFSAVPWVKGKETFAVFATEGGSPAQALSGLNEIVDVRFVDDHPAWLRNRTILEKQRVDFVPNFGGGAQKRRIVGLTISAEDARLLRAAERLGRLEAFRRDPKDVEDRVSPKERDNLRELLLPNAAESKGSSSTTPPATPSATSQFKIFKLYHARAGAMTDLLAQVVRANGFTAVADERTNSVIVTSPDEESSLLAEALLAKLDEAPPRDTSDPLTSLPFSASKLPAKPLSELQKSYTDHEASAARQAKELRDFTANADRSTPGFAEEQNRRRDQLSKSVHEAFNARQQMLQAELEALQSKIAATQQSLELRNKASDQIVKRRVDDLLNPDLKWDDAGVLTSPDAPSPLAASTKASFARSGTTPPPGPRPSQNQNPLGRTAQIPNGSRIMTITVDETQSAVDLLQVGDKVDVLLTYDSQTPIGVVTKSVTFLERVDVFAVQDKKGGGGARQVSLVATPDEVNYLAVAQRKGKLGLAWRNPLDKTVRVSKAASEQLLAELREKDASQKPASPEKPAAQATGGGGAGQFGPFGSKPSPGQTPMPTVEATATFGQTPGATDPNPFARQEKKSRRVVIEGLTPQRAQALLEEHQIRGEVTGREDAKLDVLYQATDEVHREVQDALGVESIKARQEAYERQLAMLTGIWDLLPPFAPVEGGPTPRLVVYGELAATFEGNQRKRLWSLKSEESGRYTFTALDGQPGMQGTYDPIHSNGQLTLVSVGQEGAQIVYYTRSIPLVPPEWVTDMEKAAPKVPKKMTSSTDVDVELSDPTIVKGGWNLLMGGGKPLEQSRGSRNPSDYLEMLNPYQGAVGEYNALLSTVSENHPQVKKLLREKAQDFQAIQVLKEEFQAELEAAERAVTLAREQAVQAQEAATYAKRQVTKGTLQQSEADRQRNAAQAAENARRSAEARLKLFQSSKDKIFPADIPGSPQPPVQVPATPVPATPPASLRPESPRAPATFPAPTTQPAAPPQPAIESAPATTVRPAVVVPSAPSDPQAPSAAPAPAAAPDEFTIREPTPAPAAAP